MPAVPATPDVLIIGAGPVGTFLCGLLRSYGCEVMVVDREEALYPHSRAVAMDDGVVRLLGMIHPTLSVWMSQNCLPAALDIRSRAPPPAGQGGWAGSTYSILGPFPPRPLAPDTERQQTTGERRKRGGHRAAATCYLDWRTAAQAAAEQTRFFMLVTLFSDATWSEVQNSGDGADR